MGAIPVTLDLFQLDPEWPGTALLLIGYPASARSPRARVLREARAVTERSEPLRIRFRAYGCFLGLTGVAVSDTAIIGVVGCEGTVRLNGRANTTVLRVASGADGMLFTQFEEC